MTNTILSQRGEEVLELLLFTVDSPHIRPWLGQLLKQNNLERGSRWILCLQ